jgi:hypothetical protein
MVRQGFNFGAGLGDGPGGPGGAATLNDPAKTSIVIVRVTIFNVEIMMALL